MNSVIKLSSIMLVGLLPAIICMVLCIFFIDEYVIYSCTIFCAACIAILRIKKSLKQPNIVLLHTFIALVICSVVKITTGNLLIPTNAVPLTLEIIIFCISLLYVSFPNIENRLYKFIFYKVAILNQVASQLIVISSMVYILLAFSLFILLHPLEEVYLNLLTLIIPPIIYILAIVANFITIRFISKDHTKQPILRVIAISDGEIMISKRSLSYFQGNKLDTPIEDNIFDSLNLADKAKRISSLTLGICRLDIEPRFSIKYKSSISTGRDIVLFILPIKKREDIKYRRYKFVTPEEIKKEIGKYSTYMKDEIDHITIAANIWKEQNVTS